MIRLDDVSRRYPGASRPALDGVSLEIQRGEFVFVTGPSGAGKSTLLKLLYAAERPDSGDVLVEGKSVVRLHPRSVPFLRRNLGIVFQDFKLLPRRTVFDNVALALEVCGQPRSVIQHKVERILQRVGLEGFGKRLPGSLSAGEQQRAAIARALVNEPSIILADEPTGNLDEELSKQIVSLLAELAQEKQAAVLMATHDSIQVALRGFRRIRLEAGKVVADAPARGHLEEAEDLDEAEALSEEWDVPSSPLLRGSGDAPAEARAITQPSGVGIRAITDEDLAEKAETTDEEAAEAPDEETAEPEQAEEPDKEEEETKREDPS